MLLWNFIGELFVIGEIMIDSYHVTILLYLIGHIYGAPLLKINIPSEQHKYIITAENGGNVTFQITFGTDLHSLNIYSSIGGKRIAHGTYNDYQFIYQSHSNRINISIEKNPAKNFVTLVTRILNVTYKDEQVFSIHPTLENKSAVQETKPIKIQLDVYEKLDYCGTVKRSADPLETAFILCGYPRPKISWFLGKKRLPQGNISELGHHKYLVFKRFEIDPTEVCGERLTYKVTGGHGNDNLTSSVKLEYRLKPVTIISAYRIKKCLYISWVPLKTGNCDVQYTIQFVTRSNSSAHQLVVNKTDHQRHCFRNIGETLKVLKVIVFAMYNGIPGNTSTAKIDVYEGNDTHGKVIQPPAPMIIIAMLSVLLFFLFTCLASLIVLKRKEKVVREGIKRSKNNQETQLMKNGHEDEKKHLIEIKVSL